LVLRKFRRTDSPPAMMPMAAAITESDVHADGGSWEVNSRAITNGGGHDDWGGCRVVIDHLWRGRRRRRGWGVDHRRGGGGVHDCGSGRRVNHCRRRSLINDGGGGGGGSRAKRFGNHASGHHTRQNLPGDSPFAIPGPGRSGGSDSHGESSHCQDGCILHSRPFQSQLRDVGLWPPGFIQPGRHAMQFIGSVLVMGLFRRDFIGNDFLDRLFEDPGCREGSGVVQF
jgi:hypothetical protein